MIAPEAPAQGPKARFQLVPVRKYHMAMGATMHDEHKKSNFHVAFMPHRPSAKRQLARQEQTMVSKRGEHARVHTYVGRGSVRRGSDWPPTIRLMVVNEVM